MCAAVVGFEHCAERPTMTFDEARTLADFDRLKAELDAADPLKPGQARFVDEQGKETIVQVGDRWEEAMERIQRRLGL